MKHVLLIGYEGETINSFLRKLRRARVRTVIDVRELPLSRKKGFSKNPLAKSLSMAGIEYLHMRKLGTPKNLRVKIHKDHDYADFFREYRKILKKNTAALKEALVVVQNTPTALMCFEKDSKFCHRSVIADELQKLSRGKISAPA